MTTRLSLHLRAATAIGLVLGAATAALGACSSSSSGETGAAPDGSVPAQQNVEEASILGPVDAGAVSVEAGACPDPTIPIVFAPMYSAFIPGSTAQTFAVPAVTADGNAATWSLSDPSQGHLQLQSFQSGDVLLPGVLITVEGTGNDAGQVTVVATESGGACGTSVLTLTQNTEDDWTIGSARYNDGVALHLQRGTGGTGGDGGGFGVRPDAGFAAFDGGFDRDASPAMLASDAIDSGSYYETDGGTACTNCHGPTATNGPYKTVSHTPEQTGGFSDMDLQNIIWNGEVPDGGYFDPSVLIASCDGGPTCTAQAQALWHSFHRWTDITSDELPGVICYLRSLTPEAQTGQSNFGGLAGRRRGDGGVP